MNPSSKNLEIMREHNDWEVRCWNPGGGGIFSLTRNVFLFFTLPVDLFFSLQLTLFLGATSPGTGIEYRFLNITFRLIFQAFSFFQNLAGTAQAEDSLSEMSSSSNELSDQEEDITSSLDMSRGTR